METRIIEVKEFAVTGYGLQGPLEKIPGKWNFLNSKIAEKGIVADESFGVCLSMEGGIIHYIAGIKSHHAEKLTGTEEVIISAGKYIVAPVEGGIPAIPTIFNKLLELINYRMRDGYAIERYTHPENELIIEVWLPIE
ncbi:GyrI-like domain-containing protein [Sporosarcina sp. Marseille-Q4063]|uniref:GyrI-like domain-containing protein n=1 Tax=Sporosarcina sp. Marseille-Q4063 TaxID=2810514 RepID=UPI001BAE58CF|nr:GyrI-like domain-containing protein [Sporosarcina sp. Marseille-Q4063]QUW22903.1 GyrI-like domain-containing protein [Sporosarcina sp. Marseille-Q4063]